MYDPPPIFPPACEQLLSAEQTVEVRSGDQLLGCQPLSRLSDQFEPTEQRLMPCAATLSTLPVELICRIADWLDVRSIGQLARTCQTLNRSLLGVAIERMTSHYYGPANSEGRRCYQQLYEPLVRRLLPTVGRWMADRPPSSSSCPPELGPHLAARLRLLSHSGVLIPTTQSFEIQGFFHPLASAIIEGCGACLLCLKFDGLHNNCGSSQHLFHLEQPLCPTPVPLPQSLYSYWPRSALVLPGGRIITEGFGHKTEGGERLFLLTLYVHSRSKGDQHSALPGFHRDKIAAFSVFQAERVVSASYDGTLKIRSLDCRQKESEVITLTGHSACLTGVLAFDNGRVVSSALDGTLKVWQQGRPRGQECLATLNDISRTVFELYRIDQQRFLSRSSPNALLVWQMTCTGADCIALLDRSWPGFLWPSYDILPGGGYGLPAAFSDMDPTQELLNVLVMPCGRIVVRRWADYAARSYDVCRPHSDRACILKQTDGGTEALRVPVWTGGPPLEPYPSGFIGLQMLADGRLVYLSDDGTVTAYSVRGGEVTRGVCLGNVIPSLYRHHADRRCSIEWLEVMPNGLIIAGSFTRCSTRFFVCDLYTL